MLLFLQPLLLEMGDLMQLFHSCFLSSLPRVFKKEQHISLLANSMENRWATWQQAGAFLCDCHTGTRVVWQLTSYSAACSVPKSSKAGICFAVRFPGGRRFKWQPCRFTHRDVQTSTATFPNHKPAVKATVSEEQHIPSAKSRTAAGLLAFPPWKLIVGYEWKCTLMSESGVCVGGGRQSYNRSLPYIISWYDVCRKKWSEIIWCQKSCLKMIDNIGVFCMEKRGGKF